MMLIEVGADAAHRRFGLDSRYVAVRPHQVCGIAAQPGGRHLSLPWKDVQNQVSPGADPLKFPRCLTIYMDLPIKGGQECEVIGVRYLHPWKPVPALNGTELPLAQRAAPVIYVRLRDRPIQQSIRWPERKQQRKQGRNNVKAEKACNDPGARHGGEGLVGCFHESAGKGYAFGFVSVEERRFGPAMQNPCKLPGQVHGVADACVHTLSTDRAMDVGGISEQKH